MYYGSCIEFMVHKSSYCKCSLAWCQARTFHLFRIWTHPLQMREYPPWYAGTDKNKKSHYNWNYVNWIWLNLLESYWYEKHAKIKLNQKWQEISKYYSNYTSWHNWITWLCWLYYSGIFYSCQSIKSFRPFHSFWEEEDLSWEINTSFTEWHHYHIMGIQFQGHPANSVVAYLWNFYVCFHQFLFIIKTFRDSRLLKYLINKNSWLSVTRYKSHGLACHFMLDSLH